MFRTDDECLAAFVLYHYTYVSYPKTIEFDPDDFEDDDFEDDDPILTPPPSVIPPRSTTMTGEPCDKLTDEGRVR